MADDNQESRGSGGGKGLMIVLIALVVILIFAVIGGAYFIYSQGAAANNNPSAAHEEVKKEESDKGLSFKADISDLVLNLTDSKGKEKFYEKWSYSLNKKTQNISLQSTVEAQQNLVNILLNNNPLTQFVFEHFL